MAIHQDAKLYASVLDGGDRVAHALAAGRRAYVHVVRGAVDGQRRRRSRPATPPCSSSESRVTLEHRGDAALAAEVLLFDLP